MINTAVGWLEVSTMGPDDGRPLIMVDHAMASWASLHDIAQEVAERQPSRLVVTWSRPGCGKTPPLPDMPGGDPLLHEAGIILPALMSALGITASDFLGHSEGATIALTFAALFPERTHRIVAIAPCCFADAQFAHGTLLLPDSEHESALSTRLRSRHADPEATYSRWRQRRISAVASQWSSLEMFKGVTAPLLLIQGTSDEFNSPAQMTAAADAVSGPVNWVIIRNQGHFLHLDVPEQIVTLVSAHLEPTRRPAMLHS